MAHFFIMAMASAFYPLLLGATVVMLGGGRPVRVLSGYLVGGAIVSIGIGIALLHFLDSRGPLRGTSGDSFHPWADIVLGLIAIAVSLLMVTGHDQRLRQSRTKTPSPETVKQPWAKRVLGKESARTEFIVGMALCLPSVYYLSALTYLSDQDQATPKAYALIIVFNLIQFAIVEIPLIACLVAPDATSRRVAQFNGWLSTHWRQIGETVALGAGAYLVVRGIIELMT